jgi:hypothetical protein
MRYNYRSGGQGSIVVLRERLSIFEIHIRDQLGSKLFRCVRFWEPYNLRPHTALGSGLFFCPDWPFFCIFAAELLQLAAQVKHLEGPPTKESW